MGEPPQRVEAGRRREAAGEMVCQRLKVADKVEGRGLNGLAREPAAEIRGGLKEIDVGPADNIELAMASIGKTFSKMERRATVI